MQKDDKALDAGSPELSEISDFDGALGAELASDFDSADSAGTEDDDDEGKVVSESDKPEPKDASKKVDGDGEEIVPEKEGEKEEVKPETVGGESSAEKIVKLPPAPEKFPDLKDGDFSKSDDGLYVVHDDVLAQDIAAVLNDDAGVFLRIYKAKPDKAEAMARIMGFSGDDTRTPGRQFADVVRALLKEDAATTERLLTNHFPFLLDPNTPAPFVFDDKVSTLREPNQKVVIEEREEGATGYSDEDLKNALYRVVAESGGALKIDDIKMEDLSEEMEAYKFDIRTGEPLPLYERLSLAVGDKYSKEEVNEDKEEADDVRQVPLGGVRKKGASKRVSVSPEEELFSDALTSQLKNL